MKKYRLLKPIITPEGNILIGAESTHSLNNYYFKSEDGQVEYKIHESQMFKHSDWFHEIKEEAPAYEQQCDGLGRGKEWGTPFERLAFWATHSGWRYCQKGEQCGNEPIIKLSHLENTIDRIQKECSETELKGKIDFKISTPGTYDGPRIDTTFFGDESMQWVTENPRATFEKNKYKPYSEVQKDLRSTSPTPSSEASAEDEDEVKEVPPEYIKYVEDENRKFPGWLIESVEYNGKIYPHEYWFTGEQPNHGFNGNTYGYFVASKIRNNYYQIHSVKRLSDKTMWSLQQDTDMGKITSFAIVGDTMMVDTVTDDHCHNRTPLSMVKNAIPPQPEPKKSYEILSFKSEGKIWTKDQGGYFNDGRGIVEERVFVEDKDEVQQVKSFISNIAWEVGDMAITNGKKAHRINAFKVIDGRMCASMNTFLTNYQFIELLEKPEDESKLKSFPETKAEFDKNNPRPRYVPSQPADQTDKKERIEVRVLPFENYSHTGKWLGYYVIEPTKAIPEEKLPSIKGAIEQVLNFNEEQLNTFLHSKTILWQQMVKEKSAETHPWEKTLTTIIKSQEKKIEELHQGIEKAERNAWNAARSTNLPFDTISEPVWENFEQWKEHQNKNRKP